LDVDGMSFRNSVNGHIVSVPLNGFCRRFGQSSFLVPSSPIEELLIDFRPNIEDKEENVFIDAKRISNRKNELFIIITFWWFSITS